LSERQPTLRAKALELLRQAFARDPTLFRYTQFDPELRPLHRDPTFRQLVAAAMALSPKRDE
jgi:hypothetical protein